MFLDIYIYIYYDTQAALAIDGFESEFGSMFVVRYMQKACAGFSAMDASIARVLYTCCYTFCARVGYI